MTVNPELEHTREDEGPPSKEDKSLKLEVLEFILELFTKKLKSTKEKKDGR